MAKRRVWRTMSVELEKEESGGQENLAEKQEWKTKKCQDQLREKGTYFPCVPCQQEMEKKIIHLTKRVTNLGQSAQESSSADGLRNGGDSRRRGQFVVASGADWEDVHMIARRRRKISHTAKQLLEGCGNG